MQIHEPQESAALKRSKRLVRELCIKGQNKLNRGAVDESNEAMGFPLTRLNLQSCLHTMTREVMASCGAECQLNKFHLEHILQ